MAKSAGCAAKIAQADLAQALAHLPKANDPNLLVDHAGSDDAAVYQLSAELALVETVDIFPPIVDDPFDYGRIAAANALSLLLRPVFSQGHGSGLGPGSRSTIRFGHTYPRELIRHSHHSSHGAGRK